LRCEEREDADSETAEEGEVVMTETKKRLVKRGRSPITVEIATMVVDQVKSERSRS